MAPYRSLYEGLAIAKGGVQRGAGAAAQRVVLDVPPLDEALDEPEPAPEAAAAPCGGDDAAPPPPQAPAAPCVKCGAAAEEREAALAQREAALRAQEIDLEFARRQVEAEHVYLAEQRKALDVAHVGDLLVAVAACAAFTALDEQRRPRVVTARCTEAELRAGGTCQYTHDVEVMTQLRLEAEARRRARSAQTHALLKGLREY